ncbi:hypothetical protein, partial [Corallococcus llansteffanensis]
MSRRVLIAGPASLLASHLAALRLASSEDTLVLLVQGPEGSCWAEEDALALVRHAVGQGGAADAVEARWAPLCARVHGPRGEGLALGEALRDCARLDEAWYLEDGARPTPGDAVPRHLIPALARLGVTEFNHVGPVGEGFEARHRDT